MYYQFTKDLIDHDFYTYKKGDKLPVKTREGDNGRAVPAVYDCDGDFMFDVNSLFGKHYGILVSYIEQPNLHSFAGGVN